MRAIVLIGINFVRTQWIALAVMCAYVLGIGGIYRVHTQRDEILFFLRWHAGYAIFFATMIAIPALQTERKTRRILAVLSKGIHRWQYLGGLLCGCTMISALFCLLIGATAAWLGQQGRIPIDGLAAIMTLLFCCCVFRCLSRPVFCDVLSSAAGYRSHLKRPGIALDLPSSSDGLWPGHSFLRARCFARCGRASSFDRSEIR